MTRRALLSIAVLLLVPAIHATPAQDVSGKWSGTFIMTVNDQSRDDVAEMTLTQKGASVAGTAGPNANQQWPVVNGKVEGAKITFDLETEGALIRFTLTLVDGRLKGDATGEMNGQTLTAKVDVGRVK